MFTNWKSMKGYSVAQDDKICHRPKTFTEFQPYFRYEGIQCRHLDDTVQPLVLHTADSPYVVCTAYSDPSSIFNNGIKSFTFPTQDVAAELFSTDTFTPTQLISHITY
jgi:hypothetical protein